MKKAFEDQKRKTIKPGKIISMTEFVNLTITRVILAKREERVFQNA